MSDLSETYSDSSNSSAKKIGRPKKYATEEERKKAKNKSVTDAHVKSGYYQREDVKERQKLMRKRYTLQQRVTKYETGGYKLIPQNFDIDNIRGQIFQINQILCAK